jgi:hypothetical protein
MIAVENFKKFRIIDLLAIILLASLSYAFDKITSLIPSLQWSFIISTLATTVLMTFTVLLLKKAGSATMFYTIRALLTYKLEGLGMNTFLILITAGIIFELSFLLLKLEVKNVPVDVIICATISNATIPVTTGLLLSTNVMTVMLYDLINLTLLYSLIGIAGAVTSFLIWHNLRLTKMVMKFEYMQ